MTHAQDWNTFVQGAETLSADNISRAVKGLPFKAKMALRGLLQMQLGSLAIKLPDGRKLLVRGKAQGPNAAVSLRNWNLAHRALMSGTIGVAETAIEAMAKRLLTRVAFGKPLHLTGDNYTQLSHQLQQAVAELM